MIAKRKTCGWAIAIISITLIIGCENRKDIIDKKDIQRGPTGHSSIRLVEDLKISKENWNPTNLEIDDKGYIYVSDADYAKIYVYDPNGNEIDRKEFRQGQGPGDINFLDPGLSLNGNFYIYDKKIRRLTIFDKDWKILDTKVLDGYYLFFLLDSKNCLYFWKYITKVVESREEVSRSLVKLSSSGRYLGEIFKYKENVDQIISNVFYIYLYPPYGIAKLDVEDFLYYSISDKYEINIASPEGKPIRRIVGLTKSRPTTTEDSERKIANFEKALVRFGNKLEFIIPDRMPAIADFFPFENKYVLVITYENPILSPTLKGHLFDQEGNFVSDIEVPRYSRWGDWGGLFKKGAIYKNNCFYTIESDEDDNFMVKRYKVVWN